jgi:uncharacterized protein (DUF1778 family)
MSSGFGENLSLTRWPQWIYHGDMTERPKRRHSSALHLRLMPEHEELIRRAAELAGVSLSDWIRERLIRAARKEIGQAV